MAVAIHTAILFKFIWILQICIDFQANPLLEMLPKTLTLLSEFHSKDGFVILLDDS
jgi:hypothetical protein